VRTRKVATFAPSTIYGVDVGCFPDYSAGVTWLERIGVCVENSIKGGQRRRDIAASAGVDGTSVDAVREGRLGTTTSVIDSVVRAAGLQIVADCIPITDTEVAIDQRLKELREHGDMSEVNQHAKELLLLCDFLIKTGHAKGAVQALHAWRSSGAGGNRQGNNGQEMRRPL
jgi:hypothetical protein